MLKYSVRLSGDDVGRRQLDWWEKYVSPDLSFVSGVTSQEYHLEKYGYLESTSDINNRSGVLPMETENVTREGFVVVKGKSYKVTDERVFDYSRDTEIQYKSLFLNGKFYYAYAENGNEFRIDGWLVYDGEGNVKEDTITVGDIQADGTVRIDTVYWIEDGFVTIDGEKYIYDWDEKGIKYFLDGDLLKAAEITDCESMEIYTYPNPKDYRKVTKFRLTKKSELMEGFEDVSHCKYFFYILYKNHYCPIVLIRTEDGGFNLVCEIPVYVLSGNTQDIVESGYTTEKLQVYLQEGEDSYDPTYVEANSTNMGEYGIYDLQDIRNMIMAVKVDDAYFEVQTDVLNSNNGRFVAIYTESQRINVGIGDTVWLESPEEKTVLNVYNVTDEGYGFSPNDPCFVIYRGQKVDVVANLCDKAVIDGSEYEIDYVNGREPGADCLVRIGGEWVPMLIIPDGSGIKLQRYGYTMQAGQTGATVAEYEINEYSGVTIDGVRYHVDETYDSYIVTVDGNNRYLFRIIEKRGSSMLICKPGIDTIEITDEFYRYIAPIMCDEVVANKVNMGFYVKNKAFGETEVKNGIGFLGSVVPYSSDDYYNLFDHLVLWVRDSYISVPLLFGEKMANNIMQDDIVEREFYESKKKEAINRIVDMEKDVYSPKRIASDNGRYSGSATDFSPIRQINVNLHFRTRNIDNWKVNEDYNIAKSSSNWFVTDIQPYSGMVATSGETLMETSDLLGLLFFTNNDVFYQKSCISKSFLRFSFYDSMDPNTQSLLATCVSFMDGHAMFKRYIDNSQKNVNDYGIVDSTETGIALAVNKISVMTEYLGEKKKNGRDRYTNNNSFAGVILDESHRMSSRFSIRNKYETETSSEGFYLYIFREYSENLNPKPIYMKVEFNHAGIGKTIPFAIPMVWSGETGATKETPRRALSLKNPNDVLMMKKGFPLSYVNTQLYIPLYAVYDFKNKEYGYVFDSRYVKQDSDEISLNLFELKIMNEDTTDENEQKAIYQHKQKRAVIDVNQEQFPTEGIRCIDTD